MIVGEFNPGSLESHKQERIWTKFRMTTKLKQVEKFQKGLGEVRSTLMLGLMYQKSVPDLAKLGNLSLTSIQHSKAESMHHK
jgi:hypothetical protein